MRVWYLTRKEAFNVYSPSRFMESAKARGIDFELVSPDEFEIIVDKSGEESIIRKGERVRLPDCIMPRGAVMRNYLARAVVTHLERSGVFVLNSPNNLLLAKDKFATMQVLSAKGIPVPKTMLAKFPLNLDIVKSEFSFPLVVKTLVGAQGKGVYLCENKNRLREFMDFIESSTETPGNMVFQEFISSSKGRDIRVFVIGGRCIGAMLRKSKRGQFKANYSQGGIIEQFPLNKDVESLAADCARILGLEVAGVDILFDGDNYRVCEVNATPAFVGFEKSTGISIPDAVFDYIEQRTSG